MQRKFYCSLPTLETLVLFEETAPALRRLLSHHDTVVLDVSAEELDTELRNPESVLQFLLLNEANGITLDTKHNCLADKQALLLAEAAGALFVLDCEPTDCEQLGSQFGVCVVSLTQTQAAATLTAHYYKQIEKGIRYQRQHGKRILSGWRDVLADKPEMPLNALIIIDNYLLKDEEMGRRNLIDLLETLLPTSLSTELIFEVLLVVSGADSLKAKVLNRVIKALEDTIKRAYKVQVGILTHNGDPRFHRRVIISNYHFLRSDRGFADFDESEAKHLNDVSIDGSYHDLTRPGNDLKWRSMEVELKSVQHLLHYNKSLKDSGKDDIIGTNRMQGYCSNRLLNLI